ncbi:MAG: hypothetical protein Q4D33_06645 [Prevotellaceae bacterium]|nr:hypothetical protein [Prevotellaceae bacterium]
MKRLLLALCLVGTAMSMMAEKGTLVLRTPREYQVMYISANGKWATGIYFDLMYSTYAFRWNLESGEINLLSSIESSAPSGISNDGVVTGQYASHDLAPNGAAIDAPGYYDTRWHTLPINGEFVGGSEFGMSMGGGISGGISPDGHWMGGASFINGSMHPIIWKDGQVEKDLWDGTEGVPYCISSDGKHIAGWKYVHGDSYGTRYACIWRDGSSEAEVLSNYGSPWCTAQMFSPNGEKLLIWGGWTDLNPESEPLVRAVYDMATREVSNLRTISDNPANHGLTSIGDDGTILGYEQDAEGIDNLATIYKDGVGYWAVDYLRDNGIYDFYNDPYVYNDVMSGYIPFVTRSMGISADSKAMGFLFYEPEGYYQSCVLLLDQEITHRAPCGLKAQQMDGGKVVRLAWRKPLTNAENVSRYAIYRNGEKVEEVGSTTLLYFDTNVTLGSYDYTITAIYNDGTESEACDMASATVSEKKWEPVYAVMARQMGFNNASMIWNKPLTNKVKKSYYDTEDDIIGFGADNQSFELAVCFDKEDMGFYQGGSITGVTFFPMSTQMGWKATVYEMDDDMNLTVLKEQRITQDLVLGELNTVTFDTPVTITGDKNIAVGITANVSDLTASNNVIGMVYGKCVPGRSDLVRNVTANDQKFFSFYDYSQDNAVTNETAWAIAMIISPPTPEGGVSDSDSDGGSGSGSDGDDIACYNIYADGSLVGTSNTERAKVENLALGHHDLGVEVVYANGEKGAMQTASVEIAIDKNAYAVNTVNAENSEDLKSIDFTWEAPVDNDRQFLGYCNEEAGDQRVVGNEEEDWALQAMASFGASVLKPFVGSQIKKFRFYPTSKADFTFMLVLNNDIIAYEEAGEYKLNEWNEVELEEPITILPGLEYSLVVDCANAAPNTPPLAIDIDSPFVGISDLVSTNGMYFSSLTESGIFGNWMIGMISEGEEESPLPIAGYDVRVDGEKKNSETIGTTAYSIDATGMAEGKHTVNVDVVYSGIDEPVEGASNSFVKMTTGIKDEYENEKEN